MTTLPKAMLFIALPMSPSHFPIGRVLILSHSRLSSRVSSTRKPSWVPPYSELLSTAALDQTLPLMICFRDRSSHITGIVPHSSLLFQHLAQCLATVVMRTEMLAALGACRIQMWWTFRGEMCLRRSYRIYNPDPSQLRPGNHTEHTWQPQAPTPL